MIALTFSPSFQYWNSYEKSKAAIFGKLEQYDFGTLFKNLIFSFNCHNSFMVLSTIKMFQALKNKSVK